MLDAWLNKFLSEHGGIAGSVHRLEGGVLQLAASVNLPVSVRAQTQSIPKGKGMAGLAWQRNRSVSTCNLQADSTGDVQPGARAVDAAAAVAIPVHDGAGELRAVVGIAFCGDRDVGEAALRILEQAAEALPGDP
jgi:hypothetical protein